MSMWWCSKCGNWNAKHEDCRWCWPYEEEN